MQKQLAILILALFVAQIAAFGVKQPACKNKEFKPVDLDIEQYMGRWYEQYASGTVKDTFEKNCVCVNANYSLNEDDNVNVYNYCYNTENDAKQGIEGTAYVQDEGSLYVSFDVPFAWVQNYFAENYGYSNYQIGYISEDYQLVIVVSCNPLYGYPLLSEIGSDMIWVMTKQQEISDEQLKLVQNWFTENNFKWGSMQKTNQGKDCIYQSD
ncbi:Calycin-like protein [Pseudocohnilembus persalinus]|uniref:Calycin-like protein n=1 Tax=Pseudocohnilembus persalinus TaxID=266149 RepID=A0A0V0R5M8_PSEPJ|nr:Calycin-like protein [Pseudocohnilembus persalinus]|eukprot:KRX09774.1 Calycin-like protein [Pseudocohnilembus persalinus]